MDSKKFFSEIRSIIREEVEYAMKKYIANQQNTSINESVRVPQVKTQQAKPVQSGGAKTALQKIMEETKLAMANSVEVGMEDLRESYVMRKPTTTTPDFSQGISENTLLNVDYSKMLKTMEEKAKANRPV